jgi:DNA-binding transcriptional ArsR family regulator
LLRVPRRSLELPFLLPESPAEPDLVAKYFRVLSDPTRVRILELLDEQGDLSVGDLVERLGQSQSRVSNHLACLRWCGFVERERRHPNVFYRVADERVLEVLSLGRALLAENADHVASCRRVGSGNC